MIWLYIACGGALGAIGRYASMAALGHIMPGSFPYGTLCVNVVGSLLMGCIIGLFAKFSGVPNEWRVFWVVGFLGSYTTFSTFSLDAVTLMEHQAWGQFAVYTIASCVFSILGLIAGLWLMRWAV